MKDLNLVEKAVFFVECENSPEDFIHKLQNQFKNTKLKNALVICKYILLQPWAENSQILEIVYYLQKSNLKTKHKSRDENFLMIEKFSVQPNLFFFQQKNGIDVLFDKKTITVNTKLFFFEETKLKFEQLQSIFYLNRPMILDPVYISKPWGQEIWYTGVEKRGVSRISNVQLLKKNPDKLLENKNSTLSTEEVPLPWFFAALPKTFLGERCWNKNLVLVKILDPSPEEVKGDLYYELHQEKNEVYIVTDIKTDVGKIKMGINPKKIEKYKNDIPQLKNDFLAVIKEYEVIRRKIDNLQDVSEELLKQEGNLRKQMDEFAGYLELQVGDVVSVPILVPHALQHGVRVIEFQTPTYERLIISFAQKVLTQNHWDTELAFQLMEITEPKKTKLKQISQNENYLEELVCSFPDFYSTRVILNANRKYNLNKQDFYQVLFLVKGNAKLQMNEQAYEIEANQCIFIPAYCSCLLTSKQELAFLICTPEKF